MKSLDLELLASTGTSYDQNRTTLAGRVSQRTIDYKPVLGPPTTRFFDVFSDTGIAPTQTFYASANGRVFLLGAIAAGVLPIFCYEFDSLTGAPTYIGRLNMSVPASPAIVHIVRSLKVVDSGTTGWKIYVVATGTILIGGSGTLLANSISRSDFVQISPPTIPFATGNDQKAVYQLGRLAESDSRSMTVTLGTPVKFNFTAHGLNNNDQVYFTSQVGAAWTASTFVINTKYFVRNASADQFELANAFNGTSISAAAGPTSVVMQSLNQEIDAFGAIYDDSTSKLYVHVGTAANPQYFVRDISVSPTYSTQAATITVASPAKVQVTGHSYKENDPVVFTSGVMPTGFALNVTYFVRNVGLNDFEVSATAGGASINNTSVSGTAQVGRSFGYTNSQWLHKTNILPAIAGTLLVTDVERNATPTNAPINGSLLNGQSCAFFATSSNLYLGRLDELTSEATTWPSLTSSNILGALNQIVAPSPSTASWADSLDHAIILAGSSGPTAYRIIVKKVENNKITTMFGDCGLDYYETTSRDNYEMKFAAVPFNFTNQNGWLFVGGTSVGQRGLIAMDIRSDCLFDFSYVVSKVITIPQNSIVKSVNILKELTATSGEVDVYYRTSGFGSISGGWISLDDEQELSIAGSTQIQFKICFKTQSIGHTSPIQISNMQIGYEAAEELSDNWEYSYDDSSSAIPTRVGFRLKKAYATSVPSTLSFRAFDLSGVQLVDHDITNEASRFQYSTDGGTTWLALGTIANTVGTLVRYTFLSPPGVDIRPSLKDS